MKINISNIRYKIINKIMVDHDLCAITNVHKYNNTIYMDV